jgi:hypothetical protein
MALLSPDDLAGHGRLTPERKSPSPVPGTVMGIVVGQLRGARARPHSAEGAKTVAMITQRDVERHRIRKETVVTIERTGVQGPAH